MPDPTSPVVDPEAVRVLVAEVLRRIRVSSPPVTAEATKPSEVHLAGRVVSLAMVERIPANAGRVTIEARAVVTPSAREHARDKGLVLERTASRAGSGAGAAASRPFLVAHAECRGDATGRAAAIARAVPGAAQLPASGLADVVAALSLQASRDAARGVLLTGRPAVAVVLANRSASLRAVTARDPATLAAAAAECNANLLVIDPAIFPAAAIGRLAKDLAVRPVGETPAVLTARPAGCGCKGH